LRLEGVLQENAFPWLALLTIGVLSFALPALDKLLDRLKRPSWLTNRVTAAGVSVLTLLLLTVCFGVLGKWGPAKGNRFVAWGVAFTVLTVMIIAVYDRAKRISSRKSFLRVAFYGAQGIILAVLSVLAYLVPRPDGVSVLRWDSLGWLCLFASLGILAMAIGFVVADLTVLLVGVLGNKIGVNPTEGSAAA
ncbi:MAG: hypothetical protein IJW46_05670, partial [Clostridia bacterium]|nr:hypothetical protein [Clostridia bacterium]